MYDVWYIYLHLVAFYGKCRQIYHTWILWDWQSLVFGLPGDSLWMEKNEVGDGASS